MPFSTRRVLIAYKNFATNRNIRHIGLGVAAINTAKTLRREGFVVDVLAIVNAAELRARLNAGVSHVVVSAPWIPPDWQRMASDPLRHSLRGELPLQCRIPVG